MGYGSPAKSLGSCSVKKLIAGLLGALLVIGAGVGFWFFLDASAFAATVGKTKITTSQLDGSVKAIIAERKTVSTAGMQLSLSPALTANALDLYILRALYKDTANINKFYVTSTQIQAAQADLVKQAGSEAALKTFEVQNGIAAKDMVLFAELNLYHQGLMSLVTKNGISAPNASTAVSALVGAQGIKEGVTVNKKYGTWDSTRVVVVPPTATAATK